VLNGKFNTRYVYRIKINNVAAKQCSKRKKNEGPHSLDPDLSENHPDNKKDNKNKYIVYTFNRFFTTNQLPTVLHELQQARYVAGNPKTTTSITSN